MRGWQAGGLAKQRFPSFSSALAILCGGHSQGGGFAGRGLECCNACGAAGGLHPLTPPVLNVDFEACGWGAGGGGGWGGGGMAGVGWGVCVCGGAAQPTIPFHRPPSRRRPTADFLPWTHHLTHPCEGTPASVDGQTSPTDIQGGAGWDRGVPHQTHLGSGIRGSARRCRRRTRSGGPCTARTCGPCRCRPCPREWGMRKVAWRPRLQEWASTCPSAAPTNPPTHPPTHPHIPKTAAPCWGPPRGQVKGGSPPQPGSRAHTFRS